jgi:hypothetical protein
LGNPQKSSNLGQGIPRYSLQTLKKNGEAMVNGVSPDVRSVDLRVESDVLQRFGVAWHYQSAAGTLIAQNDRDLWTLQTRWPEGIAPEKVDAHALLQGFAGCNFDCEILVANAWTPHLVVAVSYGTDHVFLAGDTAHQYIPTGGYGMNTGIGDACDIGWKLTAVLHGFGGPGLLASYDAERRPIGLRNREASRRHSQVRAEIAALYHPDLTASDSRGDAARIEAQKRIAAIGNAENKSFGIELGYAYVDSPVICSEPGAEIPDDPLRYVPTTAPGVRMPSVLVGNGTPIFDRLGPWFTLACFGKQPSEALVAAATRRGLPLKITQFDEPELTGVYGSQLLLVRPDQHIAWRGVGVTARATPMTSLAACWDGRTDRKLASQTSAEWCHRHTDRVGLARAPTIVAI